jgi:peptide/nickel transport system substrate-binding protein
LKKHRGCRVFAVLGIAAVASFGLVACASSGGSDGKEGGTLRAAYSVFPESMDPQLAYTAEGWNSIYNTYIPLLTYAHAEDEAGSAVIPGLAKSLPKITNGGKTYTLELRQGLKYSDGRPVKASDFKYAVERMFRLNS